MENCALFSHNVKLPDWGWGQQEVTCIKNGKIPKSIWYVESTVNALCKFFPWVAGIELFFF
jgi:dolichyl-phosphate-mannose-protein mannosyltransferase